MLLDLIIVLIYFVAIMATALSGKISKDISAEAYFLSNRNLRWPSIAISTIATNVQGYQFLGMMGSAYLFGLAQANLEINAIQGLWLAAFVFVPLYLKDKVVTITQFIQKRLGKEVALTYSLANIFLFSTVGLGAALFWGAYAANWIFGDYLVFVSENPIIRVNMLIIALGVFSAIYTFYGGLSAVVRTDIIQFVILLIGGTAVLWVAVRELGGWEQLYVKTPDMMHLHMPADHPTLPWVAFGGWFLLNINYWCANQAVMQRSLAARSLKDAQVGLMVGGVMKIFMAVIIIIPGIALAGIMGDTPMEDPDGTFPKLVNDFLPGGFRGIIYCALFASLMSTVDSTFNSLSTLWSIDIYKGYLNKQATDRQMVSAGRNSILVTLCTGILMGCLLTWVKFANPENAFTHTLNELRYYINTGIVVVICSAAFLVNPRHRIALLAFASTIPLHLLIIWAFPEMNYFVRAMWVILIAFTIVALPTMLAAKESGIRGGLKYGSDRIAWMGYGLLAALLILHIVFH